MGAKRIKAPAKAAPNAKVLPTDTRYEMLKEWADRNYTFLVGIGAAIIFIFISTWGVTYYKGSREAKAQIAYAEVASRLPAEGRGTGEEWEKLVPDLRKFIDEHKGSNAATNAQVDLARALFETKRYDEAIKTGNEALGGVASDSLILPLIRYQLAFSYAAAGKPDEAAGQWAILKNSGIRQYEREADWNLGKIYAQKKDFAKAEEMLQLALKASGDYPQPALIEREIARVKSEAGQAK